MKRTPEPKPDITAATEAIHSLLSKIEARHQEFLKTLAAAPRERPCGHHPEVAATLNEQLTTESGMITYFCPACHREAELEQFRQIQDACGVPLDVRHATFDNFDFTREKLVPESCTPGEFLKAAVDFTAGKFRNLILAGTVGIGKGHLAAGLCNAAIFQRRVKPLGDQSFRWIAAHVLFQRIHQAYEQEGPDALIDYYGRRTLLILDECGMAPMPKDGQRVLYDILDRRHKNQLPTLLLTNLNGATLRAWLGPPIVDRLRSGGLGYKWGSWASARGQQLDASTNPSEF